MRTHALLLVPLLLGAARVLPLDDGDLLVVGPAGAQLPGALAATPDPASLVLTDPYAANGFLPQQGAVYLVNDAPPPRLLLREEAVQPGFASLFPRYAGTSLAVGDHNGDGRSDLAIGIPGSGGLFDVGEVVVWLGGGDCGAPFCPGKTLQLGTAYAPGSSLSFADLDGDGADELLMGDGQGYLSSSLFAPRTGSVWIGWGRADLLPSDPPIELSRLWGADGTPLGALVRGDADWTCDGLPDLLVGCDDAFGGCGPTSALLLPNPGGGWSSGALLEVEPRIELLGLHSSVDLLVRQVPDVGDDGCDDVLLGVPGQDDGAGMLAFLPITPATDWSAATLDLSDLSAWRLLGGPGDGLGAGVELLRWTDPSAPRVDLLVSAPGRPSGLALEHRPGGVGFVRGDDAFAPGGLLMAAGGALSLDEGAAVLLVGSQGGEQVGSALALALDADGDGARDVVAGAPGLDHPDGGVNAGGLYLISSRLFRDLDGDGAAGLDDCDDEDAACLDSADCSDGDGDGVSPCKGDCDDGDASVHPDRGPREVAEREDACTGTDDDCDGALRPDELDLDGDGVLACSGDCDDLRAEVAPGFPEACNGLDDDCDGRVDEDFDADADGWPADPDGACLSLPADALDCDDRARDTHPGAAEIPGDGRDQDCDGQDGAGFVGGWACQSGGGPSGWGLPLCALLLILRRRDSSCRA